MFCVYGGVYFLSAKASCLGPDTAGRFYVNATKGGGALGKETFGNINRVFGVESDARSFDPAISLIPQNSEPLTSLRCRNAAT